MARPAGMDYLKPSELLALCLILNGHQRARSGDWFGAIQFYVRCVRFGSDFSAGDLYMNLTGVGIASIGLDAIGNAVVTAPNSELPLKELVRYLGGLATSLADLRNGIHFEDLRTRRGLVLEAKAQIGQRSPIARFFLPVRAMAAHSLTKWDDLLRRMRQASLTSSPPSDEERERLAAIGVDSDSTVLRGYSPQWLELCLAVDNLKLRLETVQVALALEKWRRQKGSYPSRLDELNERLEQATHIRYVSRSDYGYQVWSVKEQEEKARKEHIILSLRR
jgi:hypothetical protein